MVLRRSLVQRAAPLSSLSFTAACAATFALPRRLATATAAPNRLSASRIAVQARCFCTTVPLRSNTFHYRKARVTSEDAIDPLTKPSNIDKGALHVVSVPIGNLKDFTLRALDVLRHVDYIVTSDRPATKTLLDLVNVDSQGRLIHYSKTNRTATRDKLVDMLKGGRSMALVTTSGTPCVGDVGGELVQEMQRSGVRVTAVPGASAVMGALAISGLTTSPHETRSSDADSTDENSRADNSRLLTPQAFQDGSFFFGNVLPDSHGARLRLLRSVVAPATYPCVFYEVPRRLLLVLQDIAAVVPHRRVYVTHELTKLNESLHADTAERLVSFYLRQEAQLLLRKGQLVVVVAGAGPAETAAWLAKEAAKRQRLRRPLGELMKGGGSASELSKGTTSPAAASETKRGLVPTRLQRRRALAQQRRERRKKKRAALIRKIEAEQERLKMNLAINRSDASRLD